jgi:hypothetical protein
MNLALKKDLDEPQLQGFWKPQSHVCSSVKPKEKYQQAKPRAQSIHAPYTTICKCNHKASQREMVIYTNARDSVHWFKDYF